MVDEHLISLYVKILVLFDVLEFGDEVMADRGFQITEELLARNTRLVIPPGARLKSQMTRRV